MGYEQVKLKAVNTFLVGVHRIELCTSFLSGKRSTNELHTQIEIYKSLIVSWK